MIDLQNVLKVGQLVHIELSDQEGNPVRYSSRVENLTKNALTLASPIKNRVPVYVKNETPVSIWFWDNVAIYTFQTSVIKNIQGGVPMLTLHNPETIERVQNREYVRVQTNLSVTLTYLNSSDGEQHSINCKTRDISGGGMMLVINKPIYPDRDAEVYVEFDLGNERIHSMGLVVWNDWEIDSDGIERNIVGIKFTTITEKSRKTIVKYVYQKQVELRRKGLL